tara:strand:- start:18944 stop:19180 length:237 start_codon:yes stop_codon:yes gene_type:complete
MKKTKVVSIFIKNCDKSKEITDIINDHILNNYILFNKTETPIEGSNLKIMVSLTFYHLDYLKEIKETGLVDTISKIKF